jgi:hypothetical protein
VKKADMMFDNETNNRAELFMSLVAKYNAGKRLNLTMKGSFQSRCSLAAMQYNQDPNWHLNSWRKIVKRSPSKRLKKFVGKKTGLLRTPVLFPHVKSHFGKTKQKNIMKKTMIMEFMLWSLN